MSYFITYTGLGRYWHDINRKNHMQVAILSCLIKASINKLEVFSNGAEISEGLPEQEIVKTEAYKSRKGKEKEEENRANQQIGESKELKMRAKSLEKASLEKVQLRLNRGIISKDFPSLNSIEVLISSLRDE
ncbi:hypothetical protein IM40_10900 (plasmid) [Candidatus Paracaedimonas acanthamoebae]|nr:hypothetical protein IM40_10900 [Candidatus Paracaedimonas acanthamoebae]